MNDPPFGLTVYTPTYKRPNLLADCVRSVNAQTVPVEHIIVHDEVGIGNAAVHLQIGANAHLCHGEYVMVLSDDNVLIDTRFAEDLAQEAQSAPAVIFRGHVGGQILPVCWETQPTQGTIDLSNYAVRQDLWQAHGDLWGNRYEGDFDFIRGLWDLGYRFRWWDRIVFRTQAVMRGATEAEWEGQE